MKISAQEEYGLRILIRIARGGDADNMSIPVLSQMEGLSSAYVGKLTRSLRQAGFVVSNPGNVGGYQLARPASEISIKEVLLRLGGPMFSKQFCSGFSGKEEICKNSLDCSLRSLWMIIQFAVDRVLEKITLEDMIASETETTHKLMSILNRKKIEEAIQF